MFSLSHLAYIVSPRLRKNAGTSRSDCSKFAIMALRMLSIEMDSLAATAVACGADCSITIDGGGGSGSNSGSGWDSSKKSSWREPLSRETTKLDRSSCRRWRRSESLKPVAMTVIFTESFIFSSSTAPKMMLASSCAAL